MPSAPSPSAPSAAPEPPERPSFRRRMRRGVLRVVERLPVSESLEPDRPDQPLRNVVVVTGPHRSGTTIMGRLLDHAPRSFVITEPWNKDWGLTGIPHRYPHLTAADLEHPAAWRVRRLLRTGEGHWQSDGRPLPAYAPRNRHTRQRIRRLRPIGHTVIVKDPFLLLALDWVPRGLSARPPVVTLRHPCAWIASLARRNMHPWTALRSFRDQDAFGDPVVAELLAEVDDRGDDLIRAGAFTWAILARMLQVQLAGGVDAHVVRMEDFSAAPEQTIRTVLARTGLAEPSDLPDIVRRYTGEQNVVSPADRTLHVLQRNSAALATAWKDQLDGVQQATIRSITEEHAAPWYTEW